MGGGGVLKTLCFYGEAVQQPPPPFLLFPSSFLNLLFIVDQAVPLILQASCCSCRPFFKPINIFVIQDYRLLAKKFGGCFLPFFQDIILLFFSFIFGIHVRRDERRYKFRGKWSAVFKDIFSYIIGISISVSYFHAIYLEAGRKQR